MVTAVNNYQGVHKDIKGVEEEVREKNRLKSLICKRTDLNSEVDDEEVVCGHSRVNAESYKRKMVT